MDLFVPELIRRKRDGESLAPEAIEALVLSYTEGAVPDYQMAAFLMAVFFSGLDQDERAALVAAMLHSGEVLDLSHIPGIKVDKHSTGGVGDKISLALAPAVAALGVPVPMISGRGLGHTGGTLDKLEAIPGFDVNKPMAEARHLLETLGLFLIGQTEDLAPADRKLYALRDVTGTVESIPLIAASIMSKKLAEGIDGLVLDVKAGRGAFMKSLDRARDLAETLVGIGRSAGKRVSALLTDMNGPLGYAVGNALEVKEALDILRGEGPEDTTGLTATLGAEMLVLGEAAASLEEGEEKMRAVLADGRALAKFQAVIEAQGGDPRVCDDASRLPLANETVLIPALSDGYVSGIDPMKVAMGALEVGAGRRVASDAVDPSTGVVVLVRPGDQVETGEPVLELHHNGEGADRARGRLTSAVEICPECPPETDLIIERM
jgi:pyrimidine-nucleoside phosphorylase